MSPQLASILNLLEGPGTWICWDSVKSSWNPPLGLYIFWLVVSNIFYFHPYLGKISILTNIFQMGWNHQLDFVRFFQPILAKQIQDLCFPSSMSINLYPGHWSMLRIPLKPWVSVTFLGTQPKKFYPSIGRMGVCSGGEFGILLGCRRKLFPILTPEIFSKDRLLW